MLTNQLTRKVFVFLTLLLLSAKSEPLHSPLRIRVNSELLRGVFHRKDQDILGVFANMSLGYFVLLESQDLIQDLKISLVPRDGNIEDFNYHLSFDENKFIGLETQDLKFVGQGVFVQGGANQDRREKPILESTEQQGDGETKEAETKSDTNKQYFEIEGPVTDFRFSFEIGDNETSKAIAFKAFEFKIDTTQTQIRALGDSKVLQQPEHVEHVKNWVNGELARIINHIKDDIVGGSLTFLPKLPILNMMPLIGAYQVTNLAEKVQFADDYLEYNFSPQSMKFIKQQRTDLLKPINTQFAKSKDGKDPSAIQLIIDENFANAGFNRMISIDKKFSLREFMSKDPKFALFRQLLTTSTVGMAIPSFKEEYGEGKALDIISTVNHYAISETFEMTPSGFSLDQKGNWRVALNIGSQIIIERTPGNWEDSRKLVMTIAVKGKIFVADAEFDNRTMVVMPRGVELSQLKIFKGDEEQFLEQMLAQSLIGVQLEQLRKGLKPQVTPLKNFPNPPELECFGFNLTNLDLIINKGFLQLNANYIKIDEPNRKEFCEKFELMLKSSPEKVTEYVTSHIPGLEKMRKTPGFDEAVGGAFGGAKNKARSKSKDFKKNRRNNKKEEEEEVQPVINIPEDVAREFREDL